MKDKAIELEKEKHDPLFEDMKRVGKRMDDYMKRHPEFQKNDERHPKPKDNGTNKAG